MVSCLFKGWGWVAGHAPPMFHVCSCFTMHTRNLGSWSCPCLGNKLLPLVHVPHALFNQNVPTHPPTWGNHPKLESNVQPTKVRSHIQSHLPGKLGTANGAGIHKLFKSACSVHRIGGGVGKVGIYTTRTGIGQQKKKSGNGVV